jgi:hypothetical protein
MDCPICFEISSGATRHVAGSCDHGVCIKCADQLFLENAGARSAHQREGLGTGPEFIPGLGKCPLCRQVLLYGDLKYVDTLEDAFPGDPLDDRVLDAVYVGNPKGIGWASIHLFEPTGEDDETAPSSTPIQNGAIQPLSSSSSYILRRDTRIALTDPKFFIAPPTRSAFASMAHPAVPPPPPPPKDWRSCPFPTTTPSYPGESCCCLCLL